MAIKGIMKGLQKHSPDLEWPCPICFKIPRGPTIDVSKSAPRFMLQMDLAICSATSQPFVFPSIRKHSPPGILKLLVPALRNQDKKVKFI